MEKGLFSFCNSFYTLAVLKEGHARQNQPSQENLFLTSTNNFSLWKFWPLQMCNIYTIWTFCATGNVKLLQKQIRGIECHSAVSSIAHHKSNYI